MPSKIQLRFHILLGLLIGFGGMLWLGAVYLGSVQLRSAWSLPPYRISLHGLLRADQEREQDGVRLAENAMLELLIQPLEPVSEPVRIEPYIVSSEGQLQRWMVQFASYNQGAFVLRAKSSSLPGLTDSQHHLIFVICRNTIQEKILHSLFDYFPYEASLFIAPLLYGRVLFAEVNIVKTE